MKTLDARTITAALMFIPYVWWRLREFIWRDLWLDEREQLRGITQTLKNMLFHFIPDTPGGAPGDYLLTWPFAQFSTDKWILAIPHFICMDVLYVLFVRLARERIR